MVIAFRGQSYKWPAWEIDFPGDDEVPADARQVRLLEVKSGNLTRLTVLPGGEWHGVPISHSGEIHSQGNAVLAIASSGSWSGGSNYRGWIFGKPGAIVTFSCKGTRKWLVFHESGWSWESILPGTQGREL